MRFKRIKSDSLLGTYTRVEYKPRGRYMTQKRKAEIRHRRQLYFVLAFAFFMGFVNTLPIAMKRVKASESSAVNNTSGIVELAGSGQVAAEELPQKLTLRIEIRKYICDKFGKDCEKALKIAQCESGFNPEAIGVNKNKTVDRGVFQLNTVHKHISSACAFDARCNIDAAYNLYLKQGFRPWVCNKKV